MTTSTIDDEDKVVHFLGCTQDSGLFKVEWVEKWKVAFFDRTWTVVRNLWVEK